jgi:hypothetical protein
MIRTLPVLGALLLLAATTVQAQCDDCDGDGYRAAVDCNDQDASVHPLAPEVCDGIDNDCDARVDEALVMDCSTACGTGTSACGLGTWLGCTAPPCCDVTVGPEEAVTDVCPAATVRGTTVCLRPGVYVVPSGCTIEASLISTDGPGVTIIDSSLTVHNSSSELPRLQGLTITGGVISNVIAGFDMFDNDVFSSVDMGSDGGMQIVSNWLRRGLIIRGGASVRHNIIDLPGVSLFSDLPREASGNAISGGLVFNSVGRFLFQDNVIDAVDVGIEKIILSSRESASIRIVGNTIRGGNIGISAPFGGEIGRLDLFIALNHIAGFNTAGVVVSLPDLPLPPWAFMGNVIDGAPQAGSVGKGIVVSGGGLTEIAGNTIVHTSTAIDMSCSVCDGFAGDIASNVVAMNTVSGITVTPNQPVTAVDNDVYQSGTNWGGIPDPTGSTGNMSVDPEFKDDTGGDLSLRSSSPCIELGRQSTLSADVTGLPRSLDSNLDGAAAPDIGAFETSGEVEGVRVEGMPPILRWDAHPFAVRGYDMYEGLLSVLSATGNSAQSPPTCGYGQTAIAIPVSPPAGDGQYYLVVPHGVVAGSLGFDSNFQERVNSLPCP